MIWLVVFRVALGQPGFVPDVIELPFATTTECWNAGFAMKARDPRGILWFSCEKLVADEDWKER